MDIDLYDLNFKGKIRKNDSHILAIVHFTCRVPRKRRTETSRRKMRTCWFVARKVSKKAILRGNFSAGQVDHQSTSSPRSFIPAAREQWPTIPYNHAIHSPNLYNCTKNLFTPTQREHAALLCIEIVVLLTEQAGNPS